MSVLLNPKAERKTGIVHSSESKCFYAILKFQTRPISRLIPNTAERYSIISVLCTNQKATILSTPGYLMLKLDHVNCLNVILI